jgi:parallel beta-helix repeat protein
MGAGTKLVRGRGALPVSAVGVVIAMPLVFAGSSHATLRAPALSCGATITVSTKLDRDIVDCPNNGITIGADNVTLDLNGHVIDGDGSEFSGCGDEPCDVGVLSLGHRGVTIKGGAVRDFSVGALVVGATDSHLVRVATSNSLYSGVVVFDSSHSSIDGVTAVRNGLTTDQAGIDFFDSEGLTITRNVVRSNGDIGFFISGLDDSRLEGNVISRNPEAAILLDHGNRNVFSENRISDAVENGIVVSGDGNVVVGNVVSGAVGCAIEWCGFGISVEGGTGNVIEGNTVARMHRAGIRVAAFEQFGGPPTRETTVRRNLVRDSVFDGLLVEATATDTVLDGNIALAAGDDGIQVDNAETTLTDNVATRNGDHGIEAVAGVTDGGGNHAQANGNPIQCTFVTC